MFVRLLLETLSFVISMHHCLAKGASFALDSTCDSALQKTPTIITHPSPDFIKPSLSKIRGFTAGPQFSYHVDPTDLVYPVSGRLSILFGGALHGKVGNFAPRVIGLS